MRIYSKGDYIFTTFPATGVWHQWVKGSHTVNVYSGGSEIDCYTFGWEKNETSMLDFTSALQSYLEWVNA